jgi:parvulin-like peptidyl-prolyl isomerase
MRNFVLAGALVVCSLAAQDMVRGTVDGKPVTQAQLEALINLVPPEQRGPLSADPQELLRFYGFIVRMYELAEKDKLAEQSPYKEQLEVGRKFALAVAEMSEHGKGNVVSNADVEKYYEAHKDSFTTAYVTVVQVPVKNESEAAAAKTKAETLSKKVQSGGDFDALAKEYPVDGNFKSFKKSDNLPAEIKDVVFQLKPGQVTKPIARPNGVFLIRLDKLEAKPLQDARGDIVRDMQNEQYQKWMDGIRKSVVIGK